MGLGVANSKVRLDSKVDIEIFLSSPDLTERFSVTIDRAAGRTGLGKVPRGALYGRQTAAPGKYAPFFINGTISSPTNTTNATVTVPDATLFKVGDVCTYWDESADALHTESKTITAVDLNTKVITFSGTWTTPPVAGDLLVLKDGTEQSEDVVVALEDVDFTDTSPLVLTVGFRGTADATKISRNVFGTETVYDATKNPRLAFYAPTIG